VDEEEEKIEPTLTGMPIEVHIRRHSQFLIVLTFCLFLGWYTFALFLIAWITGARWAENEGYLEKYKMDLVWGRSFMMWRTDWGKEFIEKISDGTYISFVNKPFWRRVGDVWVVTVFFIMIFMFLLLCWQATLAWQIPKSSSVSPKMMIGLPGLNPVIPLWYGILALVIAMVVHEFSHGILSRVANVKIKALGLLMFFFPVGAFVEPDEEQMKSMKKWERMRLYAAGPGSNMVIAIIFSFLFSSVMVASLEPSSDGVLSANVVLDYGGGEAGLEPWMLLTEVNDQVVSNSEDFSNIMNETYAGQVVNVSVLNKGNPETYEVTLSDKGSYYLKYYPDSYETWMSGKGFMGIAVVNPELIADSLANPGSSGGNMLQYITLPFQKLQPFPEHFTALFSPTGIVGIIPDSAFWILANSFYWIFWLNLMVGLTNALPAVPLDGGFIFADGVTGMLGKVRSSMTAERKEEIVDRFVSFLAITVLFLIIWQLVGPRLVGTEPVTLNADIDASITKGWSDEIFEFDASGSEGAFITYEWDFGDGNTAVGERVEHNWSQGGLYFVVLTAKDAEDRQSVAFQEISIDHKESGDGDVAGGDDESVSSLINPYVENVNIYINLTGQSGIPAIGSDVTVTITSPTGVVFEESYNLGNNQQQYIEYKTSEGEMVGDWEVNLESNDPASDFSYNYNWVTYFQDNS
jgi:membrane-associated protease RseP (regulator of RpoE activity)|tara:strand:+ start:3392 stop:5461 length:2070 start_codon:yes stop_codon:yes gene_type:complete